MDYWLVKFAPFRYSWNDVLMYNKFRMYSVRNYQSRNNLKKMKIGDLVLFYHSQKDNFIMGIMEVSHEAYQDPTTSDKRWVSVNFKPTKSLTKKISLKEIKSDPELQNITLIKQPRLSVMHLSFNEFTRILNLAETEITTRHL